MSKRKALRIVLSVAIALKSGMMCGGQVSPATQADWEDASDGDETSPDSSEPTVNAASSTATNTATTATQLSTETTSIAAPDATLSDTTGLTTDAAPVTSSSSQVVPAQGASVASSTTTSATTNPVVTTTSDAASSSAQVVPAAQTAALPAPSVTLPVPSNPSLVNSGTTVSVPFSNIPVAPVSNLNTAPDEKDNTVTVRTGVGAVGASVEKQSTLVQEADSDQSVIDTVDSKSSSGNWVYKNYWWRKIEEVYGDIKEVLNKVMTSRMIFFTQRNEVDKELDRFYQQVGLEQGQLEDILNVGLELMDKEQKEQGFLNAKERAFFDKIKDRKRQLEQLKADVKAIEELDNKIDEAIDIVLKQGDVCSKYEQQAWEIFKSVARELSDKEAQKQYYVTQTLLDDTHKVNEYLVGDFTRYFQQMVQSVKEHTQSIVAQLTALDKEGISFKKELEIFEREDEASEKEELEKKRKAQEKAEQEKKQKEVGFFSRVMSGISLATSTIVVWTQTMINSIKELFGFSSKKEVSQTAQVNTPESPVQSEPTQSSV